MLIDFSVENYMSIKNPLTLSMIASDEYDDTNVRLIRVGDDLRLLPSATIYGFNASGKSNMLKAMGTLKKQIVYSKIPDLSILNLEGLDYRPFKLDDNMSQQPTSMRLRACVKGQIYTYLIEYDADGVEYEELSVLTGESFVTVFSRERSDIEASFNVDMRTVKKLCGNNMSNKLIIGAMSIFSEVVDDFVQWVDDDFTIISSAFNSRDNLYKTTEYILKKDERFHRYLLNMLNDISFSNICDIKAEEITESIKHEDLPERIKVKLQAEGISKMGKRFPFKDNSYDELTLNTMKVGKDEEGNDRNVIFNLLEESEGTIKIYALYAFIYEALYMGKTLVIDEMTSFIHPLISRYIFSLFQDPDENQGGQLISSTHTTDLLEMDNLRKDQVYIADKRFNDTTLYSLSDMLDVSKDENFRNAYLAGKYGGLNYFRRELYEK